MTEYIYLITPFFAWLVTGITKFAINSLKNGRLAYDLIGYGGMPSNHSAIVCSIAAMIALKQGINDPSFGVAIALAFIVILDATSLRQKVGQHAKAINSIDERFSLRERIGHTRLEILAGVVSGGLSAWLLFTILHA